MLPDEVGDGNHVRTRHPLSQDWERGRCERSEPGEGHTNAGHLASSLSTEGEDEAYIALWDFCAQELRNRYTRLEPRTFEEATARFQEEMRLIKKHGLAGFFLCYRDILGLAKSVAAEVYGRDPSRPKDERPPGRGRGSSVGSIVCYLIGLSHIDPIANNLFLGRFLNDEMTSVPDIDIDFPREIRERLIERMYEHYGHEHVALVCTFPTYQIRSAVRDVGKALGLPAAELDKLAKLSGWASAKQVAEEMAHLPEFRDRIDAPVWRDLVALAKELDGMPRHVSQHVGGMVISSRPLVELVPVEPAAMAGRFLCQWDKDSVDDARFIKIDFLALGMLSLVDECLDLLLEERGQHPDLGRISHTDSRVYDMICRGDTLGVFQIESRAQIQTLPRTKPRSIEDLTVEVAIIRPGPITGGALNPYILRRQGREPVTYDLPELGSVLEETLGVILYQEQVLQVAMIAAGFSAGQAESLRRAMSRKRSREALMQLWQPFRDGALARGVPEETAKTLFKKLLGFATFGFPKSHSSAFALLAYESAWLKLYYPAHFYAALFNNQPMGFYSPAVLTGDARRHGIAVLPPDVNRSGARCTVEGEAVRLGFNYVEGLGAGRRGFSPQRHRGTEKEKGEDGCRCERCEELGRHGLTEANEIPRSARSGSLTASPNFSVPPCLCGEKPARFSAADLIQVERGLHGPYRSLFEFVQRTGLKREQIENLIAVGAFDELGLGRRELIWQLGLFYRPVREQLPLPLPLEQDMVRLPEPNAWERLAAEYAILGLSAEGHPMALMRPRLHEGIVTSTQLERMRDGLDVTVAGLVVCRQRPMTAKGFLFLSLEDERGLTNVIVKPWLYERERIVLRAEPFLTVRGLLQRKDGTTNVVARRIQPLAAPAAFAAPDSHDWG
jgi:error-prone DNA polymerase